MPSIITGGFAPPGVYTQTTFGAAQAVPSVPPLVPLFIGTGSEILVQTNLPVVRGSSSSVDQQIVNEDESGRAVVSVAPSGAISLGAFDGNSNKFQVKNFPLVTGDGSGTTATDTASVSVTVNGDSVVVLGIDGAKGVVEISEYPVAGDVVLVTYYFDRTDTRVTDDVSAQVTSTAAVLNGRAGESFTFASGSNLFRLSVDGLAAVTVSLPSATVSAAVVAATINGTAGIGTLVASTFVNNLGETCLRLSANYSVSIGDGTANGVLGFVANEATSRNATFFVFNGPIVDGSGGGVTSTNPANVVVKVNGNVVTAAAVNGRTRAVTLPYAPKAGSTVTIQYYFNSWQDTFDYLAHTGVTAITRAALTATSNGAGVFIQGADYVLEIDRFKTDNIAEYFRHILYLHQKWDFRKIRAEATAAQSVIIKDLKQNYVRVHGLSLAIEEHSPTKNQGTKQERVNNILQNRYKNLQVWHYMDGECQTLEDELVMANPPHDDCKDSLAAAIDSAVAPSGTRTMSRPLFSSVQPYNPRFGGIQ